MTRSTIQRHRAKIVFFVALSASFVSIALAAVDVVVFLVAVTASVAYNIWSLMRNERSGFVRSSEMKRAHEPSRHFSAVHVFILIAMVMLQLMAVAYVLLT